MNYLTNYNEADYPNTFGNEYERYSCHECGAEIYEGDDFTLEGFYQGEKIIVCEICKDEIISEHPKGWTEFNPHYFIYKKDDSLFEIMAKMFKPEGAL